MAQIYIAFVDTPGFFAGMIRWVIKQKYIHVVLSMDAELEEAYSVGRRNPAVPLFAGFEKEDKRKILTVFPTADYMVCSIECSLVQKEAIRQELRLTMQERFHYHYAVAGLPFILWNIPFYQENHYTCSSCTDISTNSLKLPSKIRFRPNFSMKSFGVTREKCFSQ